MGKKEKQSNHKEFLLSFFSQPEVYLEKEVNGWWLIQHWDGHNNKWTVDLYSAQSYRNFKNAQLNFEKPNLSWIQ